MQRRYWLGAVLGLFGSLVASAEAQQNATQRLDDLLAKWRGQPAARLREVWGREQSTEQRGDNTVLVYEKRQRVRASLGVGGVAVTPNSGSRCVVRFEISAADEVLRTARQGGGQECWSAWRGLDP